MEPRRAGRHDKDTPLVPARILNEFVYCPRLAYLEWVQEWESSSDTVEGRHEHRRVDKQGGALSEPDDDSVDLRIARSVELSSEKLDQVAKIDLVESEDGEVRPVDYKRGKRPHVPRQANDPERVQLCAQGLLLEEHGYTCHEGLLYFAGSRERVRVAFDEELRTLTLESLRGLRGVVDAGEIPPPLEDSPKCPRCSLVGICLPDETNLLKSSTAEVRPISVQHTRAMPVYVQSYRGKDRQGRPPIGDHQGRGRHDLRTACGCLPARRHGQRLCHDTNLARTYAPEHSGDVAVLRRLVPGAYDRRVTRERRTENSAVQGVVRRLRVPRAREGNGCRRRSATLGRCCGAIGAPMTNAIPF